MLYGGSISKNPCRSYNYNIHILGFVSLFIVVITHHNLATCTNVSWPDIQGMPSIYYRSFLLKLLLRCEQSESVIESLNDMLASWRDQPKLQVQTMVLFMDCHKVMVLSVLMIVKVASVVIPSWMRSGQLKQCLHVNTHNRTILIWFCCLSENQSALVFNTMSSSFSLYFVIDVFLYQSCNMVRSRKLWLDFRVFMLWR